MCRTAETYFIVYNFTNWLLDMHQSCTDQCKYWGGKKGVQAFSPSTLKCIQLKKKKVHIVPTTVCSGCHAPLPANQENLMCFPSHTCTWCPVTPLSTVLFSISWIYAEAHPFFSSFSFFFYVVNTFPSTLNNASLCVQVS